MAQLLNILDSVTIWLLLWMSEGHLAALGAKLILLDQVDVCDLGSDALKGMSPSFPNEDSAEAESGLGLCLEWKQLRSQERFRCGGLRSRQCSAPVAWGLWENPLTSLNSDRPECFQLRDNYICPVCFIGRSAQLR